MVSWCELHIVYCLGLYVVSSSLQLILRDNDIADVPSTLDACVKLKTLHLQGNQINVVPPELGTFILVDC